MKKQIKISTVVVLGLFLSLTLMPAVSGNPKSNTFEIEYSYDSGDPYHFTITLTPGEIQAFKNSWVGWEDDLRTLSNDGKIDQVELQTLGEITVDLVWQIKNLTYDENTGQYYFPPINIRSFIFDHLLMIGTGMRVFSIGRGRDFIPFNIQGECFAGTRFAPIFVKQQFGFTRVKMRTFFPLMWSTSDRLFSHNLVTVGFTGLYVNFGERFLDTTYGPILQIGKPLMIRVGDA